MDCGPAALTCLLRGFGIHASYGRLREACQTEVDGTSINTLEDVARLLGLDAVQTMVPLDHLFLPGAGTMPALIVTLQPGGGTHFIVIWRAHGSLVQIMDPAVGRRWITQTQLLRDIYQHRQHLPAAAWRSWAASPSGVTLLRSRLAGIGVREREGDALIARAAADPEWNGFATLDAAIRFATDLVTSGGIDQGIEAAAIVDRLVLDPSALPTQSWAVTAATGDDEGAVILRGAVFIHARGRDPRPSNASLSIELAAALSEPPVRPGRMLWRLVHEDGLLAPLVLSAAIAWAAFGTVVEALLMRGLFDLGHELQTYGQRLSAYAALVLFVAVLAFAEIPVAAGLLRSGRRLENSLRLRFLGKIPRLGDRYLQSRPKSDMAERAHLLHRVRHVPAVAARFLRAAFELVFVAAGLVWLEPSGWPIVLLALASAVALPLMVQPALGEADLRLRSHSGAITRFYLDALLGIAAIRAHGGDEAMRGAHRGLVGEWRLAALGQQRRIALVEGLQLSLGFGLSAWLVMHHFARVGDSGSTLLLVFWALSLPAIAQDLAQAAWQYPSIRTTTLRLVEPLGAPDETAVPTGASTLGAGAGLAVSMQGVTVRAGGHEILRNVDLQIAPGRHVAIVGASGAGKSSLVGVLLGWHRAADGEVHVDGVSLDGAHLDAVRQASAWVDPEVQLWNRTLFDNLSYGAAAGATARVGDTITDAALEDVLYRWPDGLQTMLGEGGSRASGGEGQRVRVGRALLRGDARLVVLDEPFRGLDQPFRERLLARCRAIWSHATLLCITHDVAQTTGFDEVIVMAGGEIGERGSPVTLAADQRSHYKRLLDAGRAARQRLWSGQQWRRLAIEDGQLVERGRA